MYTEERLGTSSAPYESPEFLSIQVIVDIAGTAVSAAKGRRYGISDGRGFEKKFWCGLDNAGCNKWVPNNEDRKSVRHRASRESSVSGDRRVSCGVEFMMGVNKGEARDIGGGRHDGDTTDTK